MHGKRWHIDIRVNQHGDGPDSEDGTARLVGDLTSVRIDDERRHDTC